MQNFFTFSVKFSVCKYFTSGTVFSTKSLNVRYQLTLTCSFHFWHLQSANIRFSKCEKGLFLQEMILRDFGSTYFFISNLLPTKSCIVSSLYVCVDIVDGTNWLGDSTNFKRSVQSCFVMTLWKIFAVDTQFKQLRKRSLKKIQASAGFEPVTSAIPVQCSTNWAMKP